MEGLPSRERNRWGGCPILPTSASLDHTRGSCSSHVQQFFLECAHPIHYDLPRPALLLSMPNRRRNLETHYLDSRSLSPGRRYRRDRRESCPWERLDRRPVRVAPPTSPLWILTGPYLWPYIVSLAIGHLRFHFVA